MELKNMTPYELEKLIEDAKNILALLSNSTTVHHDLIDRESHLDCCPICGNSHIVKNGHKDGVQRYICKNCKSTFGSTHNTLLYNSHINYTTMLSFIHCELDSLTLKQSAERTGLSKTTCFSLRHKLYNAIKNHKNEGQLEGQVEMDAFFKAINLKGTRPRRNA